MIYLFWPHRSIPEWLLRVKFSGEGTSKPVVEHRGWGFVIRFRGRLLAYLLRGTFAYIDGGGRNIEVTGGYDGLDVISSSVLKTVCFYLDNIKQ